MTEKSFSERMGIGRIKAMQTKSLDEETKNVIWSVFYNDYWGQYSSPDSLKRGFGENNLLKFATNLWLDFFKFRVDAMTSYVTKVYDEIFLMLNGIRHVI